MFVSLFDWGVCQDNCKWVPCTLVVWAWGVIYWKRRIVLQESITNYYHLSPPITDFRLVRPHAFYNNLSPPITTHYHLSPPITANYHVLPTINSKKFNSIYYHIFLTMSDVFWCNIYIYIYRLSSNRVVWADVKMYIWCTSGREPEEIDSTGNICLGCAVNTYECYCPRHPLMIQ